MRVTFKKYLEDSMCEQGEKVRARGSIVIWVNQEGLAQLHKAEDQIQALKPHSSSLQDAGK